MNYAEAVLPRIQEMLSQPDQSECDLRWNPIKLEIARAIDERRTEAAAYAEKLSNEGASSSWPLVSLHPTVFRDDRGYESNDPLTWKNEEFSWEDLANQYEKAKHLPYGPEWHALNSGVRGILFDDESRYFTSFNFGIDHEQAPLLAYLLKDLENCTARAACTAPAYSSESLKLLAVNEDYSELNRRLGEAPVEEKSRHLESFLKRVRAQHQWHSFEPYSAIRSSDGKKFTVPLHGGDFLQSRVEIETILESYWKDDQHSVDVQWVDPAPDLFRMVFKQAPGDRAYVSFKDRTLNLMPLSRIKTLVHEFGHVLGFADVYYTQFDSDRCVYVFESNSQDIMSDSHPGRVLPAHFETLKAQYSR